MADRLRIVGTDDDLGKARATAAAAAIAAAAAAPGVDDAVEIEIFAAADPMSEVMNERAEVAVLAGPDLPARFGSPLQLAATLERGPTHDIIISRKKIDQLPKHARVNCYSRRAQMQLLRFRPGLRPFIGEGDVSRRIEQWKSGGSDAAILPKHHMMLLGIGRDTVRTYQMPAEEFLPTPHQGILALIAARAWVIELCQLTNQPRAWTELDLERMLMADLDSDLPWSCEASTSRNGIFLRAELIGPDGRQTFGVEKRFPVDDAYAQVVLLRRMLDEMVAPLLDSVYAASSGSE